jgi:3' terminal RNA ribose 2'-O-methyltransferase Hen1
MLLTIAMGAVDGSPATDLGFLLHKHPDRVQEFAQSFGTATVFYPDATPEHCTAALMIEVDPIRLARSRARNAPDFSLAQYVNDRPYAASSLLAVALAAVFSTARSGRCDARQSLADSPVPLVIEVPALPCRGGAGIAHRLFEPLGWTVAATPVQLDPSFPDWGDSRYVSLRLSGDVRMADALNQLHVLLPVLDESKHYWQAADEVDKLLRSGGTWLAAHPEQELITRRYLGRQSGLTRAALARLAELGDDLDASVEPAVEEEVAQPDEHRLPLNTQRRKAVMWALADLDAHTVIDLGCGPGQLMSVLIASPSYTRIAGVDVSARSLRVAARRLRLDEMGERQRERVSLFQGALTYVDPRFEGYDAAVLMEVIEHVDPSRLEALEFVVFGSARPGAVIVTTPNAEYNANYQHLVGMRHPDHRFEWTRAEFASWCDRVCVAFGYQVELRGVGEVDDQRGTPTQMGVFRRG